ncbi:MAG TPA: L,D-transpeptidase family protein [Steroidobacteraceae bacterium]|nr:L,D-transpeptidase family protein [Steroidobacteraceae bacterium]
MTTEPVRPQRALGCVLSLLGLALAGGCVSHPPAPAPVAHLAPPAPAVPLLPEPMDTHRFVLGPDQDMVGAVQVTTARKQDTLLDIARRFNVGYNEIVNANPGVDIWIPGAGRRVVVPTQFILPAAPREGIVIDVAALRLFYFPRHKPGEPQIVYTYPIGIGKAGWKTPEGVTHVTARVKDPVWHPSLALREDHFKDNGERLPPVVKAGPDNPLGKFEFKLGWPSYLIHGTNLPYGVGLRSSHGCVRLYPEDIEKLYQMVSIGTPVRVVNQPYLLGWHDRELYLQVYPPLQDDHRDWKRAQQRLLTAMLTPRLRHDLAAQGTKINWQSVTAIASAPRDIPVPVTGEAAGTGIDAVLAAAPTVQNRIPLGADWDGSDDVSASAKSPQQVLSDLEPAADATLPAQSAAAAATGTPGG